MSISDFKKKVNKKQNKNIKSLSKPVIEENFFNSLFPLKSGTRQK